MRPIKVLHIIDVVANNPYLNNLCDHTDPAMVEYSFVNFGSGAGFAEGLEKRGKKVYTLNSKGRRQYPFLSKNLWSILKAEDPDIVNTHLFDPSLVGLTLAKWQRRKTVLTRHHSDALHEIPSPWKRSVYLKLEDYINRRSDHIIAPSRMVRDILVNQEGVAKEKVSLIPYGQTTERFDAVTPEKVEKVRTELGMKRNLALICVSRLFHRKGHEYLFEAFAALTREGLDATLYLVGEGESRKRLETLASELGIEDRVKFLGWRDDVLELIAASDIVVHPSLEDALSQSLIESLMLCRPIVATDISGAADTLDGGKYGRLVPPADTETLRAAIEDTVGDLDTARKKAIEGREYLLSYMDSRRVAAEITQIYEKLVGGPESEDRR